MVMSFCSFQNASIFYAKLLTAISKAPVSQLVNAVLASNYTLQLRIRGRHAGIKCDLKGNIVRIYRLEN